MTSKDKIKEVFSLLLEQSILSFQTALDRSFVINNIDSNDIYTASLDVMSKDFKNETIIIFRETENNISCGFLFKSNDLHRLARIFILGNSDKTDVLNEELNDALLELLRQVISSFNTPFYDKLGYRVNFNELDLKKIDQIASYILNEEYYGTNIEAECDGQELYFILFVGKDIDNVAAIEVDKAESINIDEYEHNDDDNNEDPEDGEPPRNIDLLLDIDIPVSVKIGSTKMFLKDIASIGPGNIIELDQDIGVPIQLLANNKVIATGEIVTEDGYFGLRIKDIVNKKERVKKLSK